MGIKEYKKSIEKQRAAGSLGTPAQRASFRSSAGGGGGGAAAPSAPSATKSQKQSKTAALHAINKLIRDSSGAERTRLLSERNKISNTAASSFTAEVTASVRQTIQTEQAKASVLTERNKEIEAARKRGEITEQEAQRLRDNPEMARRTVRSATEELQRRGLAPETRFEEGEPAVIKTRKELVAERAIETRKQQLRVAGGEVIQEPSEKAFGVLTAPFEEEVKRKPPTEKELKEELEAMKGFVTFKAPEKKGFAERQLQVVSFKPKPGEFIVTQLEPKPPPETTLFERAKEKTIFQLGKEGLLLTKETYGKAVMGLETGIGTFMTRYAMGGVEPKEPTRVTWKEFKGGMFVDIKGKEVFAPPGRVAARLIGIHEGMAATAAELGGYAREKLPPIKEIDGKEIFYPPAWAASKVVYGAEKAIPYVGKKIIEIPTTPSGVYIEKGKEAWAVTKGGLAVTGAVTLGVVSEAAAEFGERPFKTITEAYVIGAGVSKALKYVPKIKFGEFDIPLEVPVGKEVVKKATEPLKIKTVGVVWGVKAQPIATWQTPGFLIREMQFGTPDISKHLLRLAAGADIKIGGALETKIIRRGLETLGPKEVTERGMKAIPPAQRMLLKTKGVKSKFIGELPKETERLGKRGTKIIIDIAREEKGIVFGGFARKGQLPKDVMARLRDIDIRFDFATSEKIDLVTQKALGRLKKLKGYKVREVPGMEGAIERKIGKEWMKVAEFKGAEPMVKGEIVPEEILGLTKVGKPIEIEKTAVTTLTEELRGVTQGIMRVQKVGGKVDIYPIAKRVKDIESTSIAGRVLEKSKWIPSKQLGRDITEIERLFGVKDTSKKLIADFRPSPKPIPKKIMPSPLAIPKRAVVSPGVSPRERMSSISISPSPHFSPSVSISESPSISKSISPSLSPSISASVSASVSPSVSPSLSPSLSISPSPSPSISPSISPSVSPSISPSVSPSISPSVSPFVTPKPPPSPLPYRRKEMISKAKKGYDTFLRRGEKRGSRFVKISSNQPKNVAIRKGRVVADTYIENTFLVKPSGKTTKTQDISPTKSVKFRGRKKGSKLPKGSRIEKKQFRISTIQEQMQLSYFRRKKKRMRF